jgi:phage terminase small subunit
MLYTWGCIAVEISNLEKTLNARQKKFVAHIVEGLSQTEAAVRAGYSKKTAASQASDLLKNPKVAAYRRALTCAVLEQLCLTPEAIALKLYGIYERCMSDSDFNPKGAIRVLELLGKNAGMFAERVEHSGGVRIGTSGSVDDAGG